MKKFLVVFILCALALVGRDTFGSPPVGKERQKLIYNFVQIAISDTLWLEDSTRPWEVVRRVSSNDLAPYISELFSFENDGKIPKRGVINKWHEQEISVGIGWPDFNVYASDNEWIKNNAEAVKPMMDAVEQQVSLLSEDIRKATGVNLSFVPFGSDAEATDDFARIRIVPMTSTRLHNRFKKEKVGLALNAHGNIYNGIKNTIFSVSFTPDLSAQVDGFYTPDHNNAIKSAVCQVPVYVDDRLMRLLISECLIRAMGLPDQSVMQEETMLAEWNYEYSEDMLLYGRDGEKALYLLPVDKSGFERRDAYYSNVLKSGAGSQDIPLDHLRPYDMRMLSILYCDAVQSGMDKNQVIQTLIDNDGCISLK